MRDEFIVAAAVLTQTVLKDWDKQHSELTPEILASAYQTAYQGLLLAKKGIDGNSNPLLGMKPPRT